tara:strand:- start:161 stop:1258 length:1098 start_codon:yes stop_codon:yes gene_type:complete
MSKNLPKNVKVYRNQKTTKPTQKEIRQTEVKFDLNDILLEPSVLTDVTSRSKVYPRNKRGYLPIFTAPMDTVVGTHNHETFLEEGINVCLPRGEKLQTEGFNNNTFISYSLVEFQKRLIDDTIEHDRVCIDIANGHMKHLYNMIRNAKKIHGNGLILMVGNVANPATYMKLSNAGADFVRVGIGNGNGCLTTENTGIGYPMGSLIRDCRDLAKNTKHPAKIVADGGMKSYSDIIKALALGADYVMVGSILNKCLESAGDCYLFGRVKISDNLAKKLYNKGLSIFKKFRGMSTKEVQLKWGNAQLKTSEGIVRKRKVEYTLHQWAENFEDYLRSAMSYTNSIYLYDFIGKTNYNKITTNSYSRFNK